MRDVIITSSVLILAILLIRQFTKGKINPLLQYMLWLLVVLRLVFPFPLWNSPVSIMNLFPQINNAKDSSMTQVEVDQSIGQGQSEVMQGQAGQLQGQSEMIQGQTSSSEIIQSQTNVMQGEKELSQSQRNCLPVVWIAGILTVGGYMLFYQIKWKRYLRKNRKQLKDINKYHDTLWIYIVEGLPSPCLSGRSIYLTEEMAADEKQLAHILAHEYCHYRHLDSLWVIVRCVLAAIYWFHPLVWVAAYLSKQDSEFACDEAAIRLLGEKERFAYGRTLIKLIVNDTCERSRMGIASTMSGGERGIRERISLIARKPKQLFIVAGVVVLAAISLIVFTFPGAKQKADTAIQEDSFTEEENQLAGTLADQDVMLREETDKQKEELTLAFAEKMYSFGDDFTSVKNLSDYVQPYYENGEEALEEGLYLLAAQNGIDGMEICAYGLYTEEYGCRGIKLLIGDDVTNFDMPWLVSGMNGVEENLRLYGLHESSGDGTIRTFALKLPLVNNSNSEVWGLYIGDRYDTGTVGLSEFKQDEYMSQMKEKLSFKIAESENKVYVYDSNTMIGAIEIPKSVSAAGKIEEVVLDGSAINWNLGYFEEELKLYTAIGLKLEGEEEIWYRGLNLISFPVECGSFGNRTFTLGQASIETDYVNGMVQGISLAYANPCPSYTRISDAFGSRTHPVTGEVKMHEGVDLAAEEGADIVAAEEGEVYETGFNTKDGNYVILYHEQNKAYTHYNGCKEILVTEGEHVGRGQKIATVGQTGMSTGPHLHFAVSVEGEFVEPVFENAMEY